MVSDLISRIASLQSFGDRKISDGGFLSVRKNNSFFYYRYDNNLFATASIGFILKGLKPYLAEKESLEVSSILGKLIPSIEPYQNKDGLKIYNFWTTRPTNHFPFGYLMRHFKHFKLPDDIDDTALAYLVKGYAREDLEWLKRKLMTHAEDAGVYNTWFGEDMPLEHDVCALCNLMYLVFESGLPLNEFDEGTLSFLKEVIEGRDYLSNTFWVSRHYASVSLIVYHYGRFLGRFRPEGFDKVKLELIKTIPLLFEEEPVWMNKVLLQTAFLKLGGMDESVAKWDATDIAWETKWRKEPFAAFIGAPLAPYDFSWTRFLAAKKLFQIQWKCEAHELALILENVILRNNYEQHAR